jgi:hypothetical protein
VGALWVAESHDRASHCAPTITPVVLVRGPVRPRQLGHSVVDGLDVRFGVGLGEGECGDDAAYLRGGGEHDLCLCGPATAEGLERDV